MQVSVEISGKPGSGKTLLANQLESLFKGCRPRTNTTVSICELNTSGYAKIKSFTIPASPSGRTDAGECGDRESLALVPREDDYWYVTKDGQYIAAACSRDDAERLMKLAGASKLQQCAVDAILAGKTFNWTGDRMVFTGGLVKNCRPSPGDFDKGAVGLSKTVRFEFHRSKLRGDPIKRREKPSAAEAPAIHDLKDEEYLYFFDENDAQAAQALIPSLERITTNEALSGHEKSVLRHATNVVRSVAKGVGAIPPDMRKYSDPAPSDEIAWPTERRPYRPWGEECSS